MSKSITFPEALANIKVENIHAGKLFEEIFEQAQNELITLSDKLPTLKYDETAAMQIMSSLIAMHLSGSYLGSCVVSERRGEMLDRLEIIGKQLGMKVA